VQQRQQQQSASKPHGWAQLVRRDAAQVGRDRWGWTT
jgi:hypothetical protein